MITTLQSSNGKGHSSAHDVAIDEARSEKQQLLLSQLHQSQEQITNLKEELQNMEDQHIIESEQMMQQMKLIEESFDNEKRGHASTHYDLNRLKEVY